MDKKNFSRPLDLKQVTVTDAFWHREQELVRKEVIPYQWEALNDRIPDAAPSYCMHNFRAAGRMMQEKRKKGSTYVAPAYTFRGFEALPEDPENPEPDKFYGFVFQDSDFSKWIEAVGYSLTQHPDAQLEQTADEAIDIVCAAQLENGYLDTYYIINGMDRAFTNLKDHHELYCLGHLIEGAVAYYQATGKDKLLNAARRYADYVVSYFGPQKDQCKGYPGHEIAEMALVRLYEVTGDNSYLELSRFFLNQRGTKPYYFDEEEQKRAVLEGREIHLPKFDEAERYAYYQAHKPVREQTEAVGHAVRAVYLYSGMADVARLTADDAMYAACQRLWDNIVREKLYVTGGIGGTSHGESFSFPFDLPNDTIYSETCAAIGLAFFARRMLEIKAESRYADVCELSLYNTVLSGMALDGKSFFYVNPLEVVPEACHKDFHKSHVKPVRQKWFGCACCPPNIARIVSSVASYAYTEQKDTLWFHLYMGSVLTKMVDGQELNLCVETNMPWNGHVSVKMHAQAPIHCTLAMRIPSWSVNGSAAVICGGVSAGVSWETGGEQLYVVQGSLKEVSVQDGYLYLSGSWQDGDCISLDFAMEVYMVTADERVREDLGKAAFIRGPVVYCMEEADNGRDLHLCKADVARIGADCQNVAVEMTEELGHPMAVLKVPGKRRLVSPPENNTLYRKYEPAQYEDVTLRLIPYYTWCNRGEGEMSVWIQCD
ncbi:MAG: glycoside hydrolase family 127 protein [Lachnospiraceae bacterium]|nr:glycoside hydrolase family 127 protein [Lachnospiraceae bacterium]